jgi:hypothetical protein
MKVSPVREKRRRIVKTNPLTFVCRTGDIVVPGRLTPGAARGRGELPLTTADRPESTTPDTVASSAVPLFVSGFHRSGTTVVATAAAAATRGATLTVGHLARRIPTLASFLHATRAAPADRGVDRLPVTESTPEEYGWLLYHATGKQAMSARGTPANLLRELVAEIAAESDTPLVVLKNPWDTGREKLLLRHFPDGRILLVRRSLGAIEDSAERALLRFLSSDGYLRALMGDDATVGKLLATLADPGRRRLLMFASRWRLRIKAVQLARTAPRLPLDRVAFICYDELRRDLPAGTGWVAHVLDPVAFGAAFTATAFPEQSPDRRRGWVVRLIDAYWARAWQRARTAQARAGVLSVPVPTVDRTADATSPRSEH